MPNLDQTVCSRTETRTSERFLHHMLLSHSPRSVVSIIEKEMEKKREKEKEEEEEKKKESEKEKEKREEEEQEVKGKQIEDKQRTLMSRLGQQINRFTGTIKGAKPFKPSPGTYSSILVKRGIIHFAGLLDRLHKHTLGRSIRYANALEK